MYLRMCMCVLQHLKKKIVYEFERDQGEVHLMVWKEKRKGENKVIIYNISGLVQGTNVGLISGNLQFL